MSAPRTPIVMARSGYSPQHGLGSFVSGSEVTFDHATFSGSEVTFGGAEFSRGTVTFDRAAFSGGTVTFDHAVFLGTAFVWGFCRASRLP
ncbi:hypothetical protein [Streptomyces sp. R35]|uniref:Pentapeptide repeat protein n=1 Tax=Streptomyces sp. R35 TaxID=3238630 RepID=A0AB39SML9_9ACTN